MWAIVCSILSFFNFSIVFIFIFLFLVCLIFISSSSFRCGLMVCSILSLLSFLSFHSNFKFLISFQCLICLIFIFSSFRCGLMVCSILSLLGWILVLLSSALHLILALYLGEHHLISDQIFSRYLAGETNPENRYW